MKQLTTDKPEGNVENSLNLFYIKDQWTWVRGGGPAPDYKDVSLCDLVRMMVKANIPDAELPKDDDNLSMMMHEWLMYDQDSAEGIIALLYNAGWAFAELRHRLAHYEDLKEQGRLVILPCKAGDTVYWLDYNRDACHDCLEYSSFYGMDSLCDEHYDLYPEVNDVGDDEICPKHFIEIVEFTATLTWIFNHRADFGKTIFLTREEAEKALKEVRGE